MILKESEYIGGSNPYDNEVESDLDQGDEESDYDPYDEFVTNSTDLFDDFVKDGGKIKNLVMEIRSVRMTTNVSNSEVVQHMLTLVLDTIAVEEGQKVQ